MPDLPLPAATLAYAAVVAVILGWNVTYAGRIARLRRAPRPLAALSGICGLLVLPALLVHVASSSLFGGRAVGGIAWLWPVTTLLFLAQAGYATLRRYVTPFVGGPLVVHDLLVSAVAVTRWWMDASGQAPEATVALSAAQASILGTWLGRAALWSPLAVALPLVAPAYPARWRLTRAARALLAVAAAFAAGSTLLELPRGFGVVRSYQAYATERLRERPLGDFAVGVKLLPTVDAAPSPVAARSDLALLDTLEADAVALTILPSAAARLLVLDSLSRVLDPVRRDSGLLIVALGFDDDEGARRAADPRAWESARLRAVDRVARALRPDVLLPAADPYGSGAAVLGRVPPDAWHRYLARAAGAVKAVNPRIRVGLMASRYDGADSALYAWGAARGSPVEVLGFAVHPSFSGAGGVDARLRAADRWMRAAAAAPDAPPRPREHWILDVHAFPATHGEASQERTVWHTVAWATAHPAVRGVIVTEPGDYTVLTGLRASNGRLRAAVGTMRRAAQGLRETVAP